MDAIDLLLAYYAPKSHKTDSQGSWPAPISYWTPSRREMNEDIIRLLEKGIAETAAEMIDRELLKTVKSDLIADLMADLNNPRGD